MNPVAERVTPSFSTTAPDPYRSRETGQMQTKERSDGRCWRSQTSRRFGGLALLVAAATIGLAACGGSGSPHVVSLGTTAGSTVNSTTTSSGPSTRTTPVKGGDATKLADEWGTCMHGHGDPKRGRPGHRRLRRDQHHRPVRHLHHAAGRHRSATRSLQQLPGRCPTAVAGRLPGRASTRRGGVPEGTSPACGPTASRSTPTR